jgi:hypothetical protein
MTGSRSRRLALAALAVGFAIALVVAVTNRDEQRERPREARAATSAPRPPTAQRRVAAALGELQRAYVAGDVRRLCQSGVIFTHAVIAARNELPGENCESDVEDLLAGPNQARLEVRAVDLRPDLAVASVTTASGATVPVDLVRRGQRWLVSFSQGEDPLPPLLR